MNSTVADPTAPPPPPPQPPRSSFSCDRHPAEQFSGFCPSCLCERLTTLDTSNSTTPSSSRRPSSASAAIKALFSSSSKTTANNFPPPPPPKPAKSTSFFPELRRSKSFSASKNEALGLHSAAFEPQRKSCDVRGRSTLCSLFSLDNDDNKSGTKPSTSSNCVANKPVLEEPETEEEYKDPEYIEEDENVSGGDEIVLVQDTHLEYVLNNGGIGRELKNSGEIIEEEEEVENLKPMKDHIDLDTKKSSSGGGGGFWAAASVFSKKWHKWRRKQKVKKGNHGNNSATLPVEKPVSTQSEIADYGFGRRSCDTDPRFSLDVGRISLDDARYSFDEPRASWDGYLIGRSFPRMPPTMVSVMEDAPSSAHVPRSDTHMPVEDLHCSSTNEDEGEGVPGGSVQTRDYYLDSSSSRRRKSLDRSSSIRKTAASVVAEIDELKKAGSNAKVSPAIADCIQGPRMSMGERDLRDSISNSNSLRDDCSETFELSSGFRDNGSVSGNGDRKESKKSRRWSWKIWGFIQRRGSSGNKDEEEERYNSRINGVERSYSESWQDLRKEGNGDVRGGLNGKVFRSNSTVSWRNSNHIASVRNSGFEVNGKKKRDEFVLERNRSARYSPNHTDNGLLRFYLTPMRSSWRGGAGKVKPNGSHSIARSVLRLY